MQFNFASDNLPAKSKKQENVSYVFKANQVPQGILEHVTVSENMV